MILAGSAVNFKMGWTDVFTAATVLPTNIVPLE